MVSFPLVKLSLLAIKQISKPITRIIKSKGQSNKNFRTYAVEPTAQIYHWFGVRMKMYMLGLGQPKYVPPLNRAMALQTGSDLLGEILIFSIAVTILVLEFSRQARKDQKKHDRHKERRLKLRADLEQLSERVTRQTNQIKDLKLRLSQLGSSPLTREYSDS